MFSENQKQFTRPDKWVQICSSASASSY